MYVCVSNTVLVENSFIKHPENVCRKLNNPDVLLIITIFEKINALLFSSEVSTFIPERVLHLNIKIFDRYLKILNVYRKFY